METQQEITSLKKKKKKRQSTNIWLETLMITKIINDWKNNFIENRWEIGRLPPGGSISYRGGCLNGTMWLTGLVPQLILLENERPLIREILWYLFKNNDKKWGQWLLNVQLVHFYFKWFVWSVHSGREIILSWLNWIQ